MELDLYKVPVEEMDSLSIVNNKMKKENLNLQRKRKQPTFGICFDCDGVLARGTIPIPAAQRAMKKLTDKKGELFVPVTFVTNSLNKNSDKAQQIGNWFNLQISPEQMIQAQGPLEVFTKYHDKFCLIIGQGKIFEIAKELGFKKMCTVEEVADAYPLLDMVDHDHRDKVAHCGYQENKEFPRVEAAICMGEPKRWESALQLVVDLLRTDGKPDHVPQANPEKHLPVIACNMDLEFMDRSPIPRYGHGAFLACLEALYKKITGRELKYTALIGKPSEITYRYAEHCITREAKKLNIEEPIKTMYLVGDTPDVDIVGSNLYQRYIDRLISRKNNNQGSSEKESRLAELIDPELPMSRNVPPSAKFYPQTVEHMKSILVCTGVYQPGVDPEPGSDDGEKKNYEGHRDFPKMTELLKPTVILPDVEAAIDYILDIEGMTTA